MLHQHSSNLADIARDKSWTNTKQKVKNGATGYRTETQNHNTPKEQQQKYIYINESLTRENRKLGSRKKQSQKI